MVIEYLFNFSGGKMGKKNFPTRKNIFSSRTIFFQPGKIFFPCATLLMDNEISN